MSITKAIIPVAGWGTRRLPITKAIEKCMLPIGNRPIIDYVVQDCIGAGITDIYFVVSEDSTQLRAYYEDNGALNTYLIGNGKESLLSIVTPPRNVRFHYVVQPTNGKYGTAIPVSLVMPEIDRGESVAVLMGDVFIYNKDGSSELFNLIAATPEGANAMLGAHVPPEQIPLNGIFEVNENHQFVRIAEKPSLEEAPSDIANTSRYIFNYQLLTEITNYANVMLSGEYYITEPINQHILDGGSMQVVVARGAFLDGGVLDGWLHANNVVHGA